MFHIHHSNHVAKVTVICYNIYNTMYSCVGNEIVPSHTPTLPLQSQDP